MFTYKKINFPARAQGGKRLTLYLELYVVHQQIDDANLVERHQLVVRLQPSAVDPAQLQGLEFTIQDLAITIQTASVKCHNRLYHHQNLVVVIQLEVIAGDLPLFIILPSQEEGAR